jgi:SAM-dependent methyltransferase
MTVSSFRSTQRFADRVADYIRYRPDYPPEVIQRLVASTGLVPAQSRVADVGSGTGFFTRRLLQAGFTVDAVEPNTPMREGAAEWLGDVPGLRLHPGSGEASGLPAQSVDLVTVAQAFHWFDVPAVRREFHRILRPPRWVALVWNVRRVDGEFEAAYERLLMNYCPEYAAGVPEQGDPAAIDALFQPGAFASWSLPNTQVFDAAGLRGRLLSSSYTPPAGSEAREALLRAADACFQRYAAAGQVSFRYDVRVFTGALVSPQR